MTREEWLRKMEQDAAKGKVYHKASVHPQRRVLAAHIDQMSSYIRAQAKVVEAARVLSDDWNRSMPETHRPVLKEALRTLDAVEKEILEGG